MIGCIEANIVGAHLASHRGIDKTRVPHPQSCPASTRDLRAEHSFVEIPPGARGVQDLVLGRAVVESQIEFSVKSLQDRAPRDRLEDLVRWRPEEREATGATHLEMEEEVRIARMGSAVDDLRVDAAREMELEAGHGYRGSHGVERDEAELKCGSVGRRGCLQQGGHERLHLPLR